MTIKNEIFTGTEKVPITNELNIYFVRFIIKRDCW